MNDGVSAHPLRKAPRQARSIVTVGAILEATLQVARKVGVPALTTTRVSERAGVSVGSFYQYFPDKNALLSAFLERHMAGFASAMERLCDEIPDGDLETMVERLARSYAALKRARADDRRSFYAAAIDLGTEPLRVRLADRIDRSVARLLDRATDVRLDDALDAAASLMRTLRAGAHSPTNENPARRGEAILDDEIVQSARDWLAAQCGRRPDA